MEMVIYLGIAVYDDKEFPVKGVPGIQVMNLVVSKWVP